jgi:hypothetical protein
MASRITTGLLTLFFFGFAACGSGDDPANDTGTILDQGSVQDLGSIDEGTVEDTTVALDEGGTPDTTQVVDEGTAPVDEGAVIVDVTQPNNCSDLTVLIETPVDDGSPVSVDVQLCSVVVTYKHNDGFFIQQSVDGPATEVYVGGDWPYPAPTEGDVLNIRVSQWASYQGHQEIIASEPPVLVGQQSLDEYALDISSGVLPSEALESRLVSLTGAKVREAVNSKTYLVDYGTAEAVNIYVSGLSEDLCTNATFDVERAVFIQYIDVHEIKVYFAGFDVTNINTDDCPPPIVHDSSNWGFESWLTTDPPEDFIKEKLSQKFAATQEGEHVKQGSNACVLSWYTTDTAELAQGWWTPAEAGKDYTHSLWAWDEADTGRVRTALKFYDADKNQVGSTEYSSYTADEGTWTELTATATAPEGAVFVRAAVRMYDEGLFNEEFGADIYIDEWNLTESEGTPVDPGSDPGDE